MLAAPIPIREHERLAQLHELDVLDTAPDPLLDRLTSLAAGLFKTPIALISLVDSERQWFKSNCGLNVVETPRSISFCGHAILTKDVFIVPDATIDERFADNPLVLGEPFVRFYAGAPLFTPSGHAIGTLCIVSPEPRSNFGAAEKSMLRGLADLLQNQLSLRMHANQTLNEISERQTLIDEVDASQRELTARLRSKRENLTTIAQNFRTPLRSLQACTAMLQGEVHGPHSHARYRDYVQIISVAATYLEAQCSAILDFQKRRTDQFPLDLRPIDMRELVSDATAELHSAMKIGRQTFDAQLPDGPWTVLADPIRLKQAFLNILTNAIKFTPADGHIQVEVLSQQNQFIEVCISDTGVGMTAHEQDLAFQTSEQTPARLRNGQRRTGIGLLMARQIAERHGGSLVIESVLGKGTTVTIRIPINPIH